MNHRTTAAALATCALAAAVLTACGSGDPAASQKEPAAGGQTPAVGTPSPAAGSEAPAASPSAAASASATSQGTGGTGQETKKGEAALPPRPDRDGEGAYVRALTAIDPDIVHDKEDQAVERGRDQCATIHDHPGDREKQIGAAMERFTSPGHPDGFGRVKSTRIVDAVHTNLCPDY
ncbi:hypothetical protein [Streptomyces sp. T028]|uniref:hypothetical protein n=1 Tax=Streptomyces sp. T028 TaxID=3394379 RepID=UPI003A8A8FAA